MTRLAERLEVGEKRKSRTTKCFEKLGRWWSHMRGKEQIWSEKSQELRFRLVKFEMPTHIRHPSGDLKKIVRKGGGAEIQI